MEAYYEGRICYSTINFCVEFDHRVRTGIRVVERSKTRLSFRNDTLYLKDGDEKERAIVIWERAFGWVNISSKNYARPTEKEVFELLKIGGALRGNRTVKGFQGKTHLPDGKPLVLYNNQMYISNVPYFYMSFESETKDEQDVCSFTFHRLPLRKGDTDLSPETVEQALIKVHELLMESVACIKEQMEARQKAINNVF